MSSLYKPLILPVDHLPQSKEGDCLPACAAMVLAYHGHKMRFSRLRRLLGTQWWGTPFSNVAHLNQRRFKFLVQQGTLDELYRHLLRNHPCIASVHTSELPYWNSGTPHVVVVVGMDQSSVYLNDPAFPDAPFQVSHGDFDLAWLRQEELFAVVE